MQYLFFRNKILSGLVRYIFIMMGTVSCDPNGCKNNNMAPACSGPPGSYEVVCCDAFCSGHIPTYVAPKKGILTYTVVSDNYNLPTAIRFGKDNGDTLIQNILVGTWTTTIHIKQGTNVHLDVCFPKSPQYLSVYYRLVDSATFTLIKSDTAIHPCNL
ncbi:MAG: hypothetical protein ACHQEM_03710 [Chitinophagales bacterium]